MKCRPCGVFVLGLRDWLKNAKRLELENGKKVLQIPAEEAAWIDERLKSWGVECEERATEQERLSAPLNSLAGAVGQTKTKRTSKKK